MYGKEVNLAKFPSWPITFDPYDLALVGLMALLENWEIGFSRLVCMNGMEEDWKYWCEQFIEFSFHCIREEGYEHISDGFQSLSLPANEEPINERSHNYHHPLYLETPLMVKPSSQKESTRIMKQCSIAVHVRLPKYPLPPISIIRMSLPTAAVKLPYYILDPPLVKNVSESSCKQKGETLYKMHFIEPIAFPTYDCLGEDHPAPRKKSTIMMNHYLELPLVHTITRPSRMRFLQLSAPSPCWPVNSYLDNIIDYLGHPLNQPSMMWNHMPSKFKMLNSSELCLKTTFCKPKFPKIIRGKRLVEEEDIPDTGEHIESITNNDQSELPVSKVPVKPPIGIQVMINRKMLTQSKVLKWLDSAPDLRIIEREFCESLNVMAINSESCIIFLHKDSFSEIKSKDLYGISRLFRRVTLVVPASDLGKYDGLKQLVNLMQIITNNAIVHLADCPIEYISSHVIPMEEGLCLLPDLTSHERILFHVCGLNHWMAQELISSHSFDLSQYIITHSN